MSTPLDVCADRDVKGLYARQRAGTMTGLDRRRRSVRAAAGAGGRGADPRGGRRRRRRADRDGAAMNAVLTDADLASRGRAASKVRRAEEIVRWAADTFGTALPHHVADRRRAGRPRGAGRRPASRSCSSTRSTTSPRRWPRSTWCGERYHLNLARARRPTSASTTAGSTDTDGCCAVRKVAPLDARAGRQGGWLSGLRRADSPDRADTPIVHARPAGPGEGEPARHLDRRRRRRLHRAPRRAVNPLLARATRRSAAGPAPGPWPTARTSGPAAGPAPTKTECGLHL